MNPHTPTLRTLAKELSLSRTTISDALRGTGRISEVTAERIRTAAARAGYRLNPLTTNLMSEMRRSRGGVFHGVLAAIDFHEPGRENISKPFHHHIMKGASARAADLGFKLEKFILGKGHLTVPRLDEILLSRGINGIIILPAWHAPDLSKLSWARYAGVYTDYVIKHPALHSICSDHYRSIASSFSILAERGYKRPGFCIERLRDDRLHRRLSSGFLAHQKSIPGIRPVPPLIVDEFTREGFCEWFRKYDPDVVICHFTDVIAWMEECGAEIPKSHGYMSLNVIWSKQSCAGFDLQPALIGARAAEAVVAQILRSEFGLPEYPCMTAIPSRWVEGPTLHRDVSRILEPADCSSPQLADVAPLVH